MRGLFVPLSVPIGKHTSRCRRGRQTTSIASAIHSRRHQPAPLSPGSAVSRAQQSPHILMFPARPARVARGEHPIGGLCCQPFLVVSMRAASQNKAPPQLSLGSYYHHPRRVSSVSSCRRQAVWLIVLELYATEPPLPIPEATIPFQLAVGPVRVNVLIALERVQGLIP